jgi:A/G-specific adenine glycosylase
VQKKYEGSVRQVRGVILAALRSAEQPVTDAAIAALWPEPSLRETALAGLIADGLAVRRGPGTYSLPH